MPYPLQTCRCKLQSNPTPRFCRDDLFCPQCGFSVAWIDSEHLLPPADPGTGGSGRTELLVYPRVKDDGSKTYELTFEYSELDPNGPHRKRLLELSEEGCRFKGQGFSPRVEVEPLNDSKALVRLVPLTPDEPLPPAGVHGRLILAGNCAVTGQVLAGRPSTYDGLDVVVFNEPLFNTTLDGESVQPQIDTLETWQLWKDGEQELTIKIEPTEAQVYLAEAGAKPSWPIEEDPDLLVKIISRPAIERFYGPGRPLEVILKLNPHTWEPQESQYLKLQIDFALGQSYTRELALKRQAEGMLIWSTDNNLRAEPLFYGERITTPPGSSLLSEVEIAVMNTGSTPLPAQVPRIADGATLREIRWIETGWADGSEKIEIIAPHASRSLRLTINLSEVTPENHPPGTPLKAEVIVQHQNFGMIWKLGVTIPSVGHRPALSAPLALDFGNTNSYGSAQFPKGPTGGPTVRSILGRSADPETFASALAFVDLDDLENPDYEIGREALEVGKAQPLRIERGLKRALSLLRPIARSDGEILPIDHPDHEFNRRRFIYPREGVEPARYSLRDLIRFYLLEAIERCEVGERGTITRMGLSYPANLGPEPRRALNLSIKDVEAECRLRHPERASEIEFRPLGPDEASAVALGFVLDPATLQQYIRPLFQDNKASFTLASFDFGGGSVDIALIQFDLTGLPPVTRYASALLGLGGDEHFGGDNVTVAAYEILAARLVKALGSPGKLPLAKLNVHRKDANPREWANRQALWNAAELAKRAACRGEPAAARTEMAALLEVLHADDQSSLGLLTTELEAGRLDLTLTEIYEHKIALDLSGLGNYSVAERLGKCVAMLREFANRAGPDASPRFLILAGAACRVPLARKLLRDEFREATIIPEDEVIPDSYRPKSKVADGLALYLKASDGGQTAGRTRNLKPAHLFTHADLLWINPFQGDHPVVWIPSCVKLDGADWHSLKIKDEAGNPIDDIPLADAWTRSDAMEIDVYRRAYPEPELVGVARLNRKADRMEPNVIPELPEPSDELDQAEVLLRIVGEEDNLLIRIRVGTTEFGDWKVYPLESDRMMPR